MADTPPPTAQPVLAGYARLPGVPDEAMAPDGTLRPLWARLAAHLDALPPEQLVLRMARADQYLNDSGVFYRQYGGDGSTERPWPLSHLPVLIGQDDWDRLSAALVQRADLLEAVMADLYGPGRLVETGRLPPSLVAGNPEWLRPMVGIAPRSGHYLHFLAFELGRGPDGNWWVLADRAQAPSGAGYALENRVATSRAFSGLFADENVHRLAGFFRAFRDAGVTRLSLGVQSFDDDRLRAIGRVHDRAQALAAAEEAAAAFPTFNLDLMYALPGQTLAGLDEDLRTALALQPPHLSVYHLTVEANTVFASRPPPLPTDDEAFAMLDRITERTAAAGLARYEVSAYARPGHACAHNLNYWQFGDYLGIGAGAHGKLSFAHRIVRQVRYRDPRRYMEQALAGDAVAQDDEIRREDLPFEFMLNALRLREGFLLADFCERTGLSVTAIQAPLQEAERRGLLQRDLHRVWPTERGFDFLSDLQSLFLPG